MAGGLNQINHQGPAVLAQASGKAWMMYNGDCVDVLKGIPDDSLHYGIWSPPFESLYTYSDDPRDLSNCQDSATFWRHYGFLCAEISRVLMPGRLISVHCMDLPLSKLRDGQIGLRDFPGDIIRAHQAAGLIYHSKVMIRKDPVSAMQRSKAMGLLHKNIVKDSAISRMTIADYIVTLRKPGENPEPITGKFEEYVGDDMTDAQHTEATKGNYIEGRGRTLADHKSISVWQKYAEAVWFDIAQSDVLSHRQARAEFDERHISPLQLTPIRRCVDLWSNPGDVVFSPFAGIGSELFVAVEMQRRAIGVELKPSYYRQAVDNLTELESRGTENTLDFSGEARS